MNISSVGIQLVQSNSGIQSRAADAGGDASGDRSTPQPPTQAALPEGVGEQVDTTV